jgi:hypothetical protein
MGNYLTVVEELQPTADRLVSWLGDSGYKVIIENTQREECPFLATLECKRLHTTLLVDVRMKLPDRETLREWTTYCRAQKTDVRYAFALLGPGPSVSSLSLAKSMGVGIFVVDKEFNVHEECDAQDFSTKDKFPALSRFPKRVRELLGPAWDVLRKGDFVQGFDDACVTFESESRKYLARHVGRRIHILDSKGRRADPTKTVIKRMTMGQLAEAFARIDGANHNDDSIGKILKELNPTRIKAAHKRRDGRSIKAIKQNGPALLWKIAQGTVLSLK